MLEFQQLPREFKPGPLHEQRFAIIEELEDIPLQTGDIFYRLDDSRGWMNLPFSRLVARATASEFSHAAMIVVSTDGLMALEVDDRGTNYVRLIDLLDVCFMPRFTIARVKDQTEEERTAIAHGIDRFLAADPDYNYQFEIGQRYECTRAVAEIWNRVPLRTEGRGARVIFVPSLLKDIVENWVLVAVKLLTPLFRYFAGQNLPLNVPLYFVGNMQNKGMLASTQTEIIFDYRGGQ